MGPEVIWVFIPLTAITLGIGSKIVQSILTTYERVQMAKLESSKRGSEEVDSGGLRDEIAKLRDTTTQHAISLQHSVERLEQRVDFLERKVSGQALIDTATAEPQQQIIGRG